MARPQTPHRHRRTVVMGAVGTVLCLLAGIGGFAGGEAVVDATRPKVHVYFVRSGTVTQQVRLAGPQTVASVLIMAGALDHDGRLLSVHHRLLDPHFHPARLQVGHESARPGSTVEAGATITLVPGTDAVEGTRTVTVTLPPPPMPQVLRHVYHRSRAGRELEVVGVHSGEVVSRRVIQPPVGPRPDTDRVVAFTFDDGPNATWTPAMLAVLRADGVKATFCEIGKMVDYHPADTRAVAAAGNELCNHTLDHVEDLDRQPHAEVEHEIGGGAQAQMALGLPAPMYYRPPGGYLSADVDHTALAHHEQVLYWKVDTEDWKTTATVASILANVEHEVEPGAIILMHDGGGKSRATSVLALAVVIAWLRSQGYSFTFPLVN